MHCLCASICLIDSRISELTFISHELLPSLKSSKKIILMFSGCSRDLKLIAILSRSLIIDFLSAVYESCIIDDATLR